MAIVSVVIGFAAGGFEVAYFYLTSLSNKTSSKFNCFLRPKDFLKA